MPDKLVVPVELIPIESALPPPGKPVFVGVLEQNGAILVLRAQYAAERTLLQADECLDEDAVYDEDTGELWCAPGWYETNEYEDIHWRIEGTVLWWARLPESMYQRPDADTVAPPAAGGA